MNEKRRLLCKNMTANGVCKYNNTCMYAHSLRDQLLLNIRHKVYNILIRKSDLSNVDLVADEDMFKCMKVLSRPCIDCINKTCVGGYNCKYGAVSLDLTICIKDLMKGNCDIDNCKLVHLTKRGLIPYYSQINTSSKVTTSSVVISDVLKIKDLKFAKKSNISKYSEITSDDINFPTTCSDSCTDTDEDILTEVLCVYNLDETIFD